MFTSAIAASINTASLTGCDLVARDLWKAYAAGMIDDNAAETLSTAIEARRRDLRGRGEERAAGLQKPACSRPTRFPPRRKQVSPDPARSRQRRRILAASGAMPPALAAKFTQGELAALAIVAGEVREHGVCDRSYAEIGARAGVDRSLARRAVKLAARYRLLSVELRPRRGQKHLTNILRVVSAEWRSWLMHRKARRIAATNNPPAGISFEYKGRDDTSAKPSLHSLAGLSSAQHHPQTARNSWDFTQPPHLVPNVVPPSAGWIPGMKTGKRS